MNNRKRKAIKPDRNKIDKIIPGKILPLFFCCQNVKFFIRCEIASHFVYGESTFCHGSQWAP